MNIYQNLSLFKLPKEFRGKSIIYVQIWWIVQSVFFNRSPQIFYAYRRFLLRLFGANIGDGVLIRPSVKVTYPWNLSIGDFSWIGDNVVLYSLGEISIENDCVISQNSYISSADHDLLDPNFKIRANKVFINSEVWVASDVFIGPGVEIGVGCVVGVRSTVLKNLPAGYICFGTPCVPVKLRKSVL